MPYQSPEKTAVPIQRMVLTLDAHPEALKQAVLCSRDGSAAWERFTLNAVVQHVVIAMPRNEASPEMKHLLIAASRALAQPPMLDEVDAADLIGGTVQSAEGIEVGEVCAITLKQDGEVTEVRMTTERTLGVGERTVILPKDSYTVLRGTIVLHISLEEIRRLPAEPGGGL
jgi:ribosomal 30S subunit maturation factor RimM